tara:strand:+ start:1885 stop:2640 length:756 start_codon:yes stop_codon:yes gene_type:complete
MKLLIKINFILLFLFLFNCANLKTDQLNNKKEKIYYTSNGFALIYEDYLYKDGVIHKKINNEDIIVIHSSLKKNTPIKITNPQNSISLKAKINFKSTYPEIFNILISKKAASILQLDPNNPYIEFSEIKKNKTFVAKKSNTFDEEKNVAEKAPVNEVKMDDISQQNNAETKKLKSDYNFVLVIGTFYYEKSAFDLKNELVGKTKKNNFSVKKLSKNKYRLSVGPFKNFNSLKSTYISLNNLGFSDLNIYKE